MKHVKGFRELNRLLTQLPKAAETRVLQAATMAGARELRKSVKAGAPRGKGKRSPASIKYKRLSQNIKVARLKSLRRAKNKRGARVSTGNAFWGMFQEFGTRFMPANPWFRPAIRKGVDKAVDKLKQNIGKGIEREAIKLARKNGVR